MATGKRKMRADGSPGHAPQRPAVGAPKGSKLYHDDFDDRYDDDVTEEHLAEIRKSVEAEMSEETKTALRVRGWL